MAQTLTTAPAISRMKTLQPVCPACGGLECLCRPRFFAGQLLTEEDLNRLDHYIVEKNKLHNRYLHGWGVVCGLEVFCHPCEGQVTVKAGYALSPCGDDIVLCADDIVNVCDLIQRCRERERLDCEPPRPAGTAECQDVVEQWVLTVCFTEQPSRGVTALRGSTASACCSSCSCGGSSNCGCGCQESGMSRKQPAAAARSTRSLSTDARSGRDLCEPTVTCESHYFSLYKASAADPRPEEALGAMIQRFEVCLKGLFDAEPALPTSIEQAQAWCCQLKQNWIDFFANLQYWLSFLPFVRSLRQAIEIICCRPLRQLGSAGLAAGTRVDKRFTAFRRAAMEINPEQEFSRVLLGAIANRDRAIDAQTLFLGAMELQDDKQQPLMTDAELRNPLQYLLINQLAPPLLGNVVPEEDVGPLQTLWANVSRILGSPQAPTGDVQTLTSQVEELKRMVQDQQARISELEQRLGNR